MVFIENKDRMRAMSLNAVLGSMRGRVGMIAVAIMACVAVGFLVYCIVRADDLASALKARDTSSVWGFGLMGFTMILVLACGFGYYTWQECNWDIGTRKRQTAVVQNSWLQYEFTPLGLRNIQSRYIALVGLEGLEVTYNTDTDVIVLRGHIYESFSHNVDAEWPKGIGEMDAIEELHIPNAFDPDLYEYLMSQVA